MKNYYFLLAILLSLFSCSKYQSETIKFKSPEGKNEISVSAEKTAPMDPLKVTVKIVVPKGDKTFFVELNAAKLDSSNVKMIWLTEDTGTLTLVHSDGLGKIMNMDFTGDKIHVIQDVNTQH